MKKEELSRKLNEILGIEEKPIDFTKLGKEDLERLVNIFTNVAQIAQVGVRSFRSRIQEGSLLLKPVREVADMRIIDAITAFRKEGGLIGLVDQILRQRRSKGGEKE